MLGFLTFVLPLAFVNYYPARYILEKESSDSLINFLSLPAGLIVGALMCLLWEVSSRHYASSGS